MDVQLTVLADVDAWLREIDRRGPGTPLAPAADAPAVQGARLGVVDAEFLLGVARNAGRAAIRQSGTFESERPLKWIPTGTVEALLWALVVTEVAPSGRYWPDDEDAGLRPEDALRQELRAVTRLREGMEPRSKPWCVLGGAADALAFVLGHDEAFWWAPLPVELRRNPPRDGAGRRLRVVR